MGCQGKIEAVTEHDAKQVTQPFRWSRHDFNPASVIEKPPHPLPPSAV